MGNGATDWDVDAEPSYPLTFDNFQLIPQSMMNQYAELNCSFFHADVFPSQGTDPEKCDNLFNSMFELLDGINLYDFYRYYSPDVTPSRPLVGSDRMGSAMVGGRERVYKKGFTAKEYTPWLKNHPLVQSEVVLGEPVSNFLNNETVRTALHIPEDVESWEQCND